MNVTRVGVIALFVSKSDALSAFVNILYILERVCNKISAKNGNLISIGVRVYELKHT